MKEKERTNLDVDPCNTLENHAKRSSKMRKIVHKKNCQQVKID